MASDGVDAARLAIRSRALEYELAISLKTAKSLGLEVRPISFRYLLTDPRQFDMSSSLAPWLAGSNAIRSIEIVQ